MAAAAAAAPDTSPQQQQEQEQRELGGLHIGCAGYSYAHWRKGIFYPNGVKQESELRYYSQVFDTCEGERHRSTPWYSHFQLTY